MFESWLFLVLVALSICVGVVVELVLMDIEMFWCVRLIDWVVVLGGSFFVSLFRRWGKSIELLMVR